MSKVKTYWYCQECGHKQTKWTGQCTQCGRWNTFSEEVDTSSSPARFQASSAVKSRPVLVRDVNQGETPRILSHYPELDRLMGGGIVPGSLTLVGGDPGIGKSTLLLQAGNMLAKQGHTVLYICGEESVEQTSMRAKRLGVDADKLYLLNETNFAHIRQHIEHINPSCLIVDSIQIVYKEEISSAPGSVSQVRENATEFMHLAKSRNISTFLIGHVTKSGDIAGPRVLEHIVDTVLYFEGDKHLNYRILRAVKNRFGPSDEIAVFQMCHAGLVEVANPSELFLEERQKQISGSVIIPTLEGSRPILIEVQALVAQTAYANPSRRSAGIEQNRLALLLAVLEKRMGFKLYNCDVFVSVAGGIKISEPAIDLGILLAVSSSFSNRMIDPETCVVGEVGLGGEIRGVPRIEARIKEAVHMGFTRCLMPKSNLKGLSQELRKQIDLIPVEKVNEAVRRLIAP